MFMISDTPHRPNTKFFFKKRENAGNIKGKKLVFPHFGFCLKTRSQFRSTCEESERNLKKQSEKPPPTLCMEMWTFPFKCLSAYSLTCFIILFSEDAYIINFLIVSHLWENEMAFISTENFQKIKLLVEKNVSCHLKKDKAWALDN